MCRFIIQLNFCIKKITLQELEVKTVNLGQTVCVACLAQESTRQGYLTQMKIGTT